MSIRHMAAVFEDEFYKQPDKALLLVALSLADSARSEDGRCWPSIEYIAKKARTSPRGVQESCRTLEAAGRLRVEYLAGPYGTNVYILPAPGQLFDSAAEAQPLQDAIPASSATKRPNRMQGSGAPLHPNRHEPSSNDEPSEEGYLSFAEICAFLLPMFGHSQAEFMRLSGEVQHMLGLAKIRLHEAEALQRFYKLPADSRHPEVKSRKQKLSKFLAEYPEQIALALKICPPKRGNVPRGTTPPPEQGAEATEQDRARAVESLRRFRGSLRHGGQIANDHAQPDIDARTAKP